MATIVCEKHGPTNIVTSDLRDKHAKNLLSAHAVKISNNNAFLFLASNLKELEEKLSKLASRERLFQL
ncbi:hypothetical protein PanWU01x14_318880 [Parasponia andersonii]|uniref:Uncharacterized protein n=1 Tax=Parasponia andersonii TaxID=3476 RepID=A0A2P5AM24_PARAD|nr:hypothetical protein PanWU01x14_318880 [Parasponia andersonii]